MTLDQTWRAEAADLGMTVTVGGPAWAEKTRGWPPALLPAEGLREVQLLMQTLWPESA